MQECPGGLSTQLEGHMGPLSSSMLTWRAQLQHPYATIIMGGMKFFGWGSDGNPNSPPQPQQQQGESKPRTPREEQVAVGQCLERRHTSLGNHQDQLCINIWCMRGWPEPQTLPAGRASHLSKLGEGWAWKGVRTLPNTSWSWLLWERQQGEKLWGGMGARSKNMWEANKVFIPGSNRRQMEWWRFWITSIIPQHTLATETFQLFVTNIGQKIRQKKICGTRNVQQ